MTKIPFNRPAALGRELEYIADAVARAHLSGDGHYTRLCHALLEQTTGCRKALLTTSCTHALEMAALLLDVGPGDEVILPSFTFVSVANAVVLRGATPVFADVRADTLNLDETRLEALVTPRTKVIVPVHYAGVGCEMDAIGAIAARHAVAIVEDNAHGLFGAYRGRPLGSIGALATQSFHETKNISCGEGGALLINDPRLIERAEILREKGTNRSRFFRGQVDKYTWVDVGSSYLPSEILAAFLHGQLEKRQDIQSDRETTWRYYAAELNAWAGDRGIGLPHVPAGCDPAWHIFYLLLPSLEDRQHLIAHLQERGVAAVFHYLPLHLSDMGRKYGGRAGDCPVTENVSDRLLRLPFYNELTEADQAAVVAAVREFNCLDTRSRG
jgi:dTDP-4-amino-4,6-dideoxygalactose transaminase